MSVLRDKYMHVRPISVKGVVLLAALAALLVAIGGLGVSAASAESPWWHLSTRLSPSNVPPGGEAMVALVALNVGDGQATGLPTLSGSFPAGFDIQSVELFVFGYEQGKVDLGFWCTHSASAVRCPVNLESLSYYNRGEAVLNPYEDIEMRVTVKNGGAAAAGAQMQGEVSGGNTPAAQVVQALPVSSTAPAFGVEHFSLVPEEEGGGVDVQAGSHPFQLTNTLTLNEGANPAKPLAMTRDLAVKLPPGLIGNATFLPQCTAAQFDANGEEEGGVGFLSQVNQCPAGSMVGAASLTIDEPNLGGVLTNSVPIFNMVPEKGEPARFEFELVHSPIVLDTSVRTGADYGVTVSVHNITELVGFISSTVTFWGVPGDERHDAQRGWACFITAKWYTARGEKAPACAHTREADPLPFLTMPTSCRLPFTSSVEGFSWGTPMRPEALRLPRAEYALQDEYGRSLGVTGCGHLSFGPSIEAQPDVQSASSPTGLSVHVRIPQGVNLGANGLDSASIKDATVTLPEGVHLNPSGADGLEACSEAQTGFLSVAGDGTDLFSPVLPAAFCPDASKIGTVEFKVPVIEHPLKGFVYLAQQNTNPFGSLVAMYIIAEDPISGVLLKLAGEVSLSETGQVTTTFRNSPQAPLEEATFSFFGGDRAPLSTPAHCGTYTTKASFTPWSETPPVEASSAFQITTGPNGSPCPAQLPFAPSLAAGTTNINAGAFTPLTTTIGRQDGNQNIEKVQLHMPPGLSGILTGIPLCPEAQANAGSCPDASLIGSTIVSVGLGGDPFSVTGGKVYLTEKYAGAPFGLSIVNPAKAGPFDLGKVVVRAKIEVDPHTAQLTVTTGEIPRILDGIPLQIKHVNVTINRAGFTFNPTNCSPLQLTGTIGSDEAASAPVSTPFQVTNCATLKFTPKIAVATHAHASKLDGASLNFKISYPTGAQGTQAWFNEAKFDLPKQLPARLTTIQQACPAATFEANRAACSPHSIIGHATVHTPVLPVPLEGPVYFVSYGGAKFPDAVLVLDGYGVHVELHGETFIDHNTGVTSATFRNTPDVPFQSIEVTIPTGPYSEFAANLPPKDNYNLCGQKLTMPTLFKAQNGLEIHQNTPIAINGCGKTNTRSKTRAQRLKAALHACHKKHGKQRAICEHTAHARYARKAGARRH